MKSQPVKEGEIFYPKGFITGMKNSASGNDRTRDDSVRQNVLQKVKTDFTINSGCGNYGSDQGSVNIASDDSGNFLCAWVDDRAGYIQINAQLFDNNGNKTGSVIDVSGTFSSWNSEPHVIFNRASREYVVLWAESGYDVQLQRISASGQLVGSSKSVNQTYATNTNNPSAAVDSAGNIIVTWYADSACCSRAIPYCRVVDRNGDPVTAQWSLLNSTSDYISSVSWDDRIAADSAGRSVVVWSSRVNGRSRIILQPVSTAGNIFSHWIVASDSTDSTDHIFPSITSTRDGHFLILWSSTNGVEGRIYHIDSGFVSPQFSIAHLPNYWITSTASSDDKNTFFVTWMSDRRYGQIITAQGQFSGSAKPMSISSTIEWAYHVRLSKGISGKLFLAAAGYDRSQTDAVLQRFDLMFNRVGPAIKLADDGCSAWQTNPIVKYNQSGSSLVVWEDQRNGYHDLYGQVLDKNGNPVSNDVLISDSATVHWISQPVIIPDNNGDFLVSFSGGDYSDQNLMVQKITKTGLKSGLPQKLTNNYYSSYQSVLAQNQQGNILVCWYYTNYTTSAVYIQKLNSNLTTAEGVISLLNNQYPSSYKRIISISVNNRFDVLVVWHDYNYNTYEASPIIKAMIFNAQGQSLSDTLRLDSVKYLPNYYKGVCKIDEDRNIALFGFDNGYYNSSLTVMIRSADDGNIVRNSKEIYTNRYPRLKIVRFENKKIFAAWNNSRNIYGVFFDGNYFPFNPFELMQLNPIPWNISHNVFDVDMNGSTVLTCYEDIKTPDLGYDIFGSIQTMPQIDFYAKEPVFEHVSDLYPNPVSGTVTIQYQIGVANYITISVYNILGQKVMDVEKSIKIPGTYDVSFSTRELPTGTYFLRYTGLKSFSRKMMVIK